MYYKLNTYRLGKHIRTGHPLLLCHHDEPDFCQGNGGVRKTGHQNYGLPEWACSIIDEELIGFALWIVGSNDFIVPQLISDNPFALTPSATRKRSLHAGRTPSPCQAPNQHMTNQVRRPFFPFHLSACNWTMVSWIRVHENRYWILSKHQNHWIDIR